MTLAELQLIDNSAVLYRSGTDAKLKNLTSTQFVPRVR